MLVRMAGAFGSSHATHSAAAPQMRTEADVRRLILKPRSHFERVAISIGLIAGATLLRWVIDRGAMGVPFATYHSAIVLAAILLDWRYALAVTVGCALAINTVFLGEGWFSEFGIARVALFSMFALSSGMLLLTGAAVRSLLASVDALMERQAGFNLELQHRIKNSLAVVQAMAAQGARATDPAEFYRSLSGRIAALAKASDLLTLGKEQDCHLPDLAEQAIAPFRETGRFRLSGSSCTLPEVSGVPLVMVLHELCTNAVKHGALSVEGGSVDLSWRIEPSASGSLLVLEWRETGGPCVIPPTHRGLGTRLLVAQKGIVAIDLNFEPDGVRCKMQVAGASG